MSLCMARRIQQMGYSIQVKFPFIFTCRTHKFRNVPLDAMNDENQFLLISNQSHIIKCNEQLSKKNLNFIPINSLIEK